jgi:hypothetical protein
MSHKFPKKLDNIFHEKGDKKSSKVFGSGKNAIPVMKLKLLSRMNLEGLRTKESPSEIVTLRLQRHPRISA